MPIYFQNLTISDDNFNEHVGFATYDIGTDKLINNHYNSYYYLFLNKNYLLFVFFPLFINGFLILFFLGPDKCLYGPRRRLTIVPLHHA